MRNCTIYIIIGLLAGMFMSCIAEESGWCQDQEEIVGINFTLSMNGASTVSRSLSPENVTSYENTIVPKDFRVLAYTSGGVAHEVTIFSMIQRSAEKNVYDISGKLEGNYFIEKVVILANCNQSSNSVIPDLKSLTYDYAQTYFNPISPRNYIPMWGEKVVTSTLEPGTSTNLGVIYLMRAMAKISVKSTGEEALTKVTLTQANNRGTCVPNSVIGSGEDLSVELPTIPIQASQKETVVFYSLDNKEAFAYLPEQSKNDKLQMTIMLGGKNYTLDFKDYSNTDTNFYFNVLRNTHYRYEVSVKPSEPDLSFNVVYKVVEWGKENIDIEFN